MPRRGRHQSTDKEGAETLSRLEQIEGVTAVIIGRSRGGKSITRTTSTNGTSHAPALQAPLLSPAPLRL